MHRHVRPRVRRRLQEVRRGHHARARDTTQVAHDDLLIAIRRVEAGPDRGGPQVGFQEELRVVHQALILLAQGVPEGSELAAQGHGDRVLELRAPHRQHVAELASLLVKRVRQLIQRLAQAVDFAPQRDAKGRRVGVVRGLRTVHVIVRIDDVVASLVLPQDLQRQIRDHLVGVHVHRGPGAPLELVDGELVHALAALDDLVAGGNDRLRLGGLHGLELHVRHRASLLHLGEGANQLGCLVDRVSGDLIVLDRSQRVNAPVRVIGYVAGPEQIFFGAGHHRSFHEFAPRSVPGDAPPW